MRSWSFVPGPLVPRSYAAALLAAFLFVMLPLAAALLLSVVQMNTLAQASRVAMARAAELGTQTRALRETLVALERSLRQGQVLGAAAIGSAYEVHRARVLLLARDLTRSSEQGTDDLEGARREIEIALGGIDDAMTRGQFEEALATFAQLETAAQRLIEITQTHSARAQQQLTEMPARVSATVLWMAVAALPLAIVLALLFAWRLGAPIQRLSAALRRLGDGDLATPVAVRGPEAVAALGMQLEWLRERLGQLEQARERLLRNVSHDLKTPLAAIAEGAASLAEQLYGQLTEAQRSVVQLIAQNTARLGARIDALLRAGSAADVVATDAAPRAAYAPFDLSGIARQVLDDHRLAMQRRRLNVVESLAPVAVVGDAEAVRVAIDNLLSNAVKFSPESGTLRVRVDARGEQAQVTVSDDGPGLAPGEAERVFQPGVRGMAAAESGAAGSGQGLAITREIAQAHGGRVWAEAPARARGATFVLVLPRLEAADALAA
jgi:two-component system sensor histidine kinase GlrK